MSKPGKYETIGAGNKLVAIKQYPDGVPGAYQGIGFGVAPDELSVDDVCQTFIPTFDFKLANITLHMQAGWHALDTGTVTITIRTTDENGHPTNTILDTSILSIADICTALPEASGFIVIPFNNTKLSKDIKYAFHVHFSYTLIDQGLYINAAAKLENPYDNGVVLFNIDGNWEFIDESRSLNNSGYQEMMFHMICFFPTLDARIYFSLDPVNNKLVFEVEGFLNDGTTFFPLKSGTVDLS